MTKETKRYSDFINTNKICIGVVKPSYHNSHDINFAFYLNEKLYCIPLRKEDNGKWTAGEVNQEQCLTKKSAVYYYCIKNFTGWQWKKLTGLYFNNCEPLDIPFNLDAISHSISNSKNYKELPKKRRSETTVELAQWLIDCINENAR